MTLGNAIGLDNSIRVRAALLARGRPNGPFITAGNKYAHSRRKIRIGIVIDRYASNLEIRKSAVIAASADVKLISKSVFLSGGIGGTAYNKSSIVLLISRRLVRSVRTLKLELSGSEVSVAFLFAIGVKGVRPLSRIKFGASLKRLRGSRRRRGRIFGFSGSSVINNQISGVRLSANVRSLCLNLVVAHKPCEGGGAEGYGCHEDHGDGGAHLLL